QRCGSDDTVPSLHEPSEDVTRCAVPCPRSRGHAKRQKTSPHDPGVGYPAKCPFACPRERGHGTAPPSSGSDASSVRHRRPQSARLGETTRLPVTKRMPKLSSSTTAISTKAAAHAWRCWLGKALPAYLKM